MATTGRLVYADSESNADLLYLTRFLAGDPFLYLESHGKRRLYLSDLEVDRGRKQSAVDEVVRLKESMDAIRESGEAVPARGYARIGLCIRQIAGQAGLTGFEVPSDFPVGLADILRGHGLGLRWIPAPFVPERAIKTEVEVDNIRAAVRHTETALRLAIDMIRASRIRAGWLYANGTRLTSETVKRAVQRKFLELDCHGYEAIVAGGEQGVDPHDRGSGPLPADRPILLDFFPRHNATRYHGDMTRTVVRGRADAEVQKMFAVVQAAKRKAESMLRAGVDGFDIHAAVKQVLAQAGFDTGNREGRMVGFFHGTGHGLGLQVHEYPRLGEAHDLLRAGHVVTIEPGLYYPGVGGVRIEDDLVVREQGCENLCQLETVLEI